MSFAVAAIERKQDAVALKNAAEGVADCLIETAFPLNEAQVNELVGAEMRRLRKESLRVILLDTRYHLIRTEEVSTGTTGHAESIEVVFDSSRLSYETLLDYFFRMHDPTTLNRQHNDVGTQYRSAIFYTSEVQKKTAESVKARWDKPGRFNRPITTEITTAGKFYSAEEYHQKYLVKHPGGYTCHVLRS